VTARRALALVWAAPCTLLGLAAGLAGLALGARVRIVSGVIEFGGGAAGRAVAALPPPFGIAAMTLGHVVLGAGDAEIDEWREHERVHVAQYEAWGPLFLPAYALASVWAAATGGHAYRDNAFEREARARSVRQEAAV
jgi:hypothetical protein